jgi:hypothetical protein
MSRHAESTPLVLFILFVGLIMGCQNGTSSESGASNMADTDTTVSDTTLTDTTTSDSANSDDVDAQNLDARDPTDTADAPRNDVSDDAADLDARDIRADTTDDVSDDSGASCTGDCTYTLPSCRPQDVQRSPGNNWSDSYSVNGKCYCDSTFDHNIGDITVQTPDGQKTVRQVCDAIGPGPGAGNNPVYNDIQCGNGPANDAGDEDWCPGRVDQGQSGCCTAGPTWDLANIQW